MKPLILLPQFVDRGGKTVYHVHEDDPNCRILKPSKMLGLLRFDGVEDPTWEPVEQTEIKLKPSKVKKGGTG